MKTRLGQRRWSLQRRALLGRRPTWWGLGHKLGSQSNVLLVTQRTLIKIVAVKRLAEEIASVIKWRDCTLVKVA